MGDRNDGFPFGEFFECVLNGFFRLGIEGRGCFIEKQDRSVAQDRPSDGEPLLLAAGEGAAFVPKDRLVALRLFGDELVSVREASGGVDILVTRFEVAVADIVQKRKVS